MTFNPRYYADKSFMLQSEYRQALKNSDVISDFSFLIGDEGTKSHFFYNQVGNFNQRTSYELNLQDVKGDNYLKRHQLNLTSPIITNENVLSSNFNINWNWIDADLDASVKIYEDLSKDNHDRYQYIFQILVLEKQFRYLKNTMGPLIFIHLVITRITILILMKQL